MDALIKGLVIYNSHTYTHSEPVGHVLLKQAGVCFDESPFFSSVSVQRVVNSWIPHDGEGFIAGNDCYRDNGGLCIHAYSNPVEKCNSTSEFVNISAHARVFVRIVTMVTPATIPELEQLILLVSSITGSGEYNASSCGTQVSLGNQSMQAIGHDIAWTALLDLWKTLNACTDSPGLNEPNFVTLLESLLPNSTVTPFDRCVASVIESTITYWLSGSLLSPPMLPDICRLDSEPADSFQYLIGGVQVHGDFIEIPSISTRFSLLESLLTVQPDPTACPKFRGNSQVCEELDVWACDSVGGCYVDWLNGVCSDTLPGFYSESMSSVASCDPIPADQEYIGLAWTSASCPTKCRNLTRVLNGGECNRIVPYGHFRGACDGDNQVYSCVMDKSLMEYISFPVSGTCQDSHPLHVGVSEVSNATSFSSWFSFTIESAPVEIGGVTGRFSIGTTSASKIRYSSSSGVFESDPVSLGGWNHVFVDSLAGTVELNGQPIRLFVTDSVWVQSTSVTVEYVGSMEIGTPDLTLYRPRMSNISHDKSYSTTYPLNSTRDEPCLFGSSVSAVCVSAHLQLQRPVEASTTAPASSSTYTATETASMYVETTLMDLTTEEVLPTTTTEPNSTGVSTVEPTTTEETTTAAMTNESVASGSSTTDTTTHLSVSSEILTTDLSPIETTTTPISSQLLSTDPPTTELTTAPMSNQTSTTDSPSTELTTAHISSQISTTVPPTTDLTTTPIVSSQIQTADSVATDTSTDPLLSSETATTEAITTEAAMTEGLTTEVSSDVTTIEFTTTEEPITEEPTSNNDRKPTQVINTTLEWNRVTTESLTVVLTTIEPTSTDSGTTSTGWDINMKEGNVTWSETSAIPSSERSIPTHTVPSVSTSTTTFELTSTTENLTSAAAEASTTLTTTDHTHTFAFGSILTTDYSRSNVDSEVGVDATPSVTPEPVDLGVPMVIALITVGALVFVIINSVVINNLIRRRMTRSIRHSTESR